MNGIFQMQGGKNWILPNQSMQTGSSGTLIGWISGQTTFVPLWDRMEGHTQVVFPDFQPMKVSEGMVCIYLFRQN
jgi:hypothetical protein